MGKIEINRTYEYKGHLITQENGDVFIVSNAVVDRLRSSILEIDGTQTKGLLHIGSPFGETIESCIFLGLKYEPDFIAKVKYFVNRKTLPKMDCRYDMKLFFENHLHRKFVAVDFYGDRR